MKPSDRIFVAGHKGLAGSAIVRRLRKAGFNNLVLRERAQLDLTDQAAAARFFETERPEHVFLAAARVGGIHANATYPAQFIRDNLAIQTNVIHSAYEAEVKKLLFLGSSCIYPKHALQPMSEDSLLTGRLEPTNEAYAIAKIAGMKMCEAYNKQFGTDFLCVMPTNLYGPNDNYDLSGSHVLPALLRKMHEAKEANLETVVVWGTGKPSREFLHSDDMADACVYLMERYTAKRIGAFVNIGTGEGIQISGLATLIARVVGFHGRIQYDTSMPDGTPKKVLDMTRLHALGWRARIGLEAGVRSAYESFLARAQRELPQTA
ncbi:MAG: GDP-L-fucose synthase family protein [Burkholderiales bacterium]